jgi:hypothetical protein
LRQSELTEYLISAYGDDAATPISTLVFGPWGAGKTYALHAIISHRERRPTYLVSLFGKNSVISILDELSLQMLGMGEKTAAEKRRDKKRWDTVITSIASFMRGHIPGLAASSGILQRQLIQYALKPGSLVCFDDLERKSIGLGMIEFLGIVEWIKEKCSVIVVGNTDSIAEPDDKEIFQRYRERVFDRECHLQEPEFDAMRTVYKNVFKNTQEPVFPDIVINEYTRSGDKNLRTLRRIGLELADLSASLQKAGESELVEQQNLIRTVVALIVEKYSGAQSIGDYLGHSHWIDENSSVHQLMEKYSLPANLSFSLDPFIDYIENRILRPKDIAEALGIVRMKPEKEALAMLVWWWVFSWETVKSKWQLLYNHIAQSADIELSIEDIVQFLYKTHQISDSVDGWISYPEVESNIISRVEKLAGDVTVEKLRSIIDGLDFSLSQAPDKHSMDPIFNTLRRIASDRQKTTLLKQFDNCLSSGDFLRASRIFAEPTFPIAQRENFITKIAEPEIDPAHFRAIADILSRQSDSAAAELIKKTVLAISAESAEPTLRERLRRLREIIEA